jgi:hypothetical protein
MTTKSLIDTIVSKIALPALAELDKEAKQSIKVIVSVMLDNQVLKQELCTRKIASEVSAEGEFKVVLRKNGTSERYNYSTECILKGLAPETGFSGFVTRGKLITDDNDFSLKILARSNRYNVWEWGKDFQF